MKVIVLDLELNQPSEKIIEIGACVGDVITGEILEDLSVLIDPKEKIAPYITALTGIDDNAIERDAISLQEGYDLLRKLHIKYMCFCNPVVWGGNDVHHLKTQLNKPDDWSFGHRWLDVKTVFQSWRMANGLSIPGSLAYSMAKMNITFEGRQHKALDDARNTFKLYYALLEKFHEEK